MMEQIFHDKKKVVLVIKNLETDQNNFCEKRYSAFATWFNFSVNKKNYKTKFSTNLILKKTNKDNFGRKKNPWEKTL